MTAIENYFNLDVMCKIRVFRNMANLSTRITIGLEDSATNDKYEFHLNVQISMIQLSESFPDIISLKSRNAITANWQM
jgi:hypothetical protein